jgi:hypothetical protein
MALGTTQEMPPDQLFGCLLSGNFALLLGDNFKQLASGLSEQRAERILAAQWGVTSQASCHRVIDDRLVRLGAMSPEESDALGAWLTGEGEQSEGAGSSMGLRERLELVAGLRRDYHGVLAWDIQVLAGLLRVALKVRHIHQDEAERDMVFLAQRARSSFDSWEEFSLCALVGLGMRNSMEIFESAEWSHAVRTHSNFLDGRDSPTRRAPWVGAGRSHAPQPNNAAIAGDDAESWGHTESESPDEKACLAFDAFLTARAKRGKAGPAAPDVAP